jgi:hypothetical protein
MNDGRRFPEGRLRRTAFTITLVGLLAAVPIAVGWLTDAPLEDLTGSATLSAAAFAAASILFLAAGRAAGAMVALPAIAIGALLDDPSTMALMVVCTAPVAEVAASVAAFGVPERTGDAWRLRFAEIRASTVQAAGSGPLRLPQSGPWVLDRLAASSAVAATVAIAAWGASVVAFGAGDDPTTRTVLPSAAEFPWLLGVGLAMAVVSAVTCFLTGRVAGVLMALPLVPAVWLDAPQRSEVVVVAMATAGGLLAVLGSRPPESPSGGR